MAHTKAVLKLYKTILRECEKFTAYNYRMYAIRRTRDAFREHKNDVDQEKIVSAIKEANTAREVIKRQALISTLYQTDKLVIESKCN